MGKNRFLRQIKGTLYKIIYEFTPMYRLSASGSLQVYKNGKWIDEERANNLLVKEIGKEAYKKYREYIVSHLSKGQVLGVQRMRLWARVTRKSIFTLMSICLTTMGFLNILFSPLIGMIGLALSIFSIMLRVIDETKPILPIKKKQKYQRTI